MRRMRGPPNSMGQPENEPMSPKKVLIIGLIIVILYYYYRYTSRKTLIDTIDPSNFCDEVEKYDYKLKYKCLQKIWNKEPTRKDKKTTTTN